MVGLGGLEQATRCQIDGGAESAVIEWMHDRDISQFFHVPGESFLSVLDELSDADVTVTTHRHESGASFAAEAFGKLTRRPAVCMATRARRIELGDRGPDCALRPYPSGGVGGSWWRRADSGAADSRTSIRVVFLRYPSPSGVSVVTRSADVRVHAGGSLRPVHGWNSRARGSRLALVDVLEAEVTETANWDPAQQEAREVADLDPALDAISSARRVAFLVGTEVERGAGLLDDWRSWRRCCKGRRLLHLAPIQARLRQWP